MMTTISCSKEDDIDMVKINDTNELVFGYFFGFCQGPDCIKTYRLTRTDLFEDVNDVYPPASQSAQMPFDYQLISQEKFALVDGLLDEIPAELLEQESQIFGCPDCADQGGFYVSWTELGETQEWFIDMSQSEIPEYLHDFTEIIQARIALLCE